jgi:hypothetical protein
VEGGPLIDSHLNLSRNPNSFRYFFARHPFSLLHSEKSNGKSHSLCLYTLHCREYLSKSQVIFQKKFFFCCFYEINYYFIIFNKGRGEYLTFFLFFVEQLVPWQKGQSTIERIPAGWLLSSYFSILTITTYYLRCL